MISQGLRGENLFKYNTVGAVNQATDPMQLALVGHACQPQPTNSQGKSACPNLELPGQVQVGLLSQKSNELG